MKAGPELTCEHCGSHLRAGGSLLPPMLVLVGVAGAFIPRGEPLPVLLGWLVAAVGIFATRRLPGRTIVLPAGYAGLAMERRWREAARVLRAFARGLMGLSLILGVIGLAGLGFTSGGAGDGSQAGITLPSMALYGGLQLAILAVGCFTAGLVANWQRGRARGWSLRAAAVQEPTPRDDPGGSDRGEHA